MRSKIGIFCMLIGLTLISGAVFLFLSNDKEEKSAETHVQNLVPVLMEEVNQIRESSETVEILPDTTPVALLTPEDVAMKETIIDGHSYIGYLEIPDLGLILPVMSDWSYAKLEISPCRFSGSLRGEDLVIMAHNYSSHFGYLKTLTEGSQIIFYDMNGVLWEYEVVALDILPGDAVEEMIAGEYDLTLFTCATNRTHRITIRCDKVESE
jgi:sortase A